MLKREGNKVSFIIFTLIIVILIALVGCHPSKKTFDIENTMPTLIVNSSNEQSQKVLIVTSEYVPYVIQAQENNGFFTEIIKEILDSCDIEYEIKFYPWARCSEMVRSGEAWASFPYGHSTDNDLTYLFSDSIYETKHKFYYLINNKKLTKEFTSYSKISDFSNYTFGGTNSYWYGRQKDIAALGIKSEWASDTDALLKMLYSKRIDFFIEDELVGDEAIKRVFPEHERAFNTLPIDAMIQDYFLIVSKDYPETQELLDKFNNSLQALKESYKFDQILKNNNIGN